MDICFRYEISEGFFNFYLIDQYNQVGDGQSPIPVTKCAVCAINYNGYRRLTHLYKVAHIADVKTLCLTTMLISECASRSFLRLTLA
jgi:hypothetical protein